MLVGALYWIQLQLPGFMEMVDMLMLYILFCCGRRVGHLALCHCNSLRCEPLSEDERRQTVLHLIGIKADGVGTNGRLRNEIIRKLRNMSKRFRFRQREFHCDCSSIGLHHRWLCVDEWWRFDGWRFVQSQIFSTPYCCGTACHDDWFVLMIFGIVYSSKGKIS